MLKQNLQMRLGQKLAPQQIQLMKLIQLHTLEFEEELERELEENPALEKAEESKEEEYSSLDETYEDEAQTASIPISTSMNTFSMMNRLIKPVLTIIQQTMKNSITNPC